MSKFKIGDKVRNLEDKLTCDMKAGEELIVRYVNEWGSVAVSREGEYKTLGFSPEDITRNHWASANFELVKDEPQKTPAEKAGIVKGQAYKILESDDRYDKIGKIVYLSEDDGSTIPYFAYTPDAEGRNICVDIKDLVKHEPTTIVFTKTLTEAQISAIKTLVGE